MGMANFMDAKLKGEPKSEPSKRKLSEDQLAKAQQMVDAFDITSVPVRLRTMMKLSLDTSTSFAKWDQLMAFDAASACERARIQALQGLPRFEDIAGRVNESEVNGLMTRVRLELSRCLPASALVTPGR
jgi:hypothetical protein